MEEGCKSFDYKSKNLKTVDVIKFYNEFDIHPPERELIMNATLYGSDNGILSADKNAIKAYLAGLKEFGIGGFVCDSRFARVSYVSGRRSYVPKKRSRVLDGNGILVLG